MLSLGEGSYRLLFIISAFPFFSFDWRMSKQRTARAFAKSERRSPSPFQHGPHFHSTRSPRDPPPWRLLFYMEEYSSVQFSTSAARAPLNSPRPLLSSSLAPSQLALQSLALQIKPPSPRRRPLLVFERRCRSSDAHALASSTPNARSLT